MAFEWDVFAREYYWVILLAIFALLALAAIAVWAILRCKYPQYEYAALDNESSFISDRLELSRKFHGDIDRNEALINCQYYLRGSTRYFLRYQLCNIGSRMDRHWFVVRDGATRTERLLTVTALPDACPLRHSPCQVRPGLQEIFLDLQHPYVHPVLDIDIKVLAERPHVVVVSPLNDVGSLKDLIYHSKYNEDWQEKYRRQGTGLPTEQVQRLARQMVEGLLFLREKDFPAFYNLHLGNVILQNGVARLTGLENVLLGYVPRVSAFIRKRICDDREIVDAVCFGHALFEMAAGYEMSTTKPTDKNFADVEHCPEVYQPILKTSLSSTAKHLLRDVQRFYRNKGELLPRGVRSKRRGGAGPSSKGTLTLTKPHPPLPTSSELLHPPAGCASSSSPPPEFSSSPPQAETPCPEVETPPLRAGTPPPHSTTPPTNSTSPPSKASVTPPRRMETPPTNSTSPPSKASETPPPEVPPRPSEVATPTWVQSQSSVSTCGSTDYCTPPSSPQVEGAERSCADCVT
ncbi:slowpoke binding protein, putative [Ixodes scapularis]|uniref:Slowpoke binding protein, putative n=1 Tax=Ixodes scapularis TaxID=6945 RepID=B7QCH4_IXOSC|nr:slowpoke binding protein, putative [Ixodes scapularis]|eukprot:XP_002413238.1 slowpoke binding protein, putative [Ixodes scapularis]